MPHPILAFTLIELLVVIALIAVLAAILIPQLLARKASGTSSAPIPYPALPTGATSGGAAAATFAQGVFTDGLTEHRRLTTQTYTFHRYDWNYTWVPDSKDKAGVVFRFTISVVDATDHPKIVGTSGGTGTVKLDDFNALVYTDGGGLASIDVEVPSGESSSPNTLKIMVEELPNASGTPIRRVFHDDVTIKPF